MLSSFFTFAFAFNFPLCLYYFSASCNQRIERTRRGRQNKGIEIAIPKPATRDSQSCLIYNHSIACYHAV